jgi:hypothetical protein
MRVMVTSRTIGAVIAFAAAGGAIVVAGRAIVGGTSPRREPYAWQVSKNADIAQLLN